MRDEIEARIWIAHHAAFSDWVERAAAALGGRLHRLSKKLAGPRTRAP